MRYHAMRQLCADPVVQIEGNPHCCFFNFSPKIMFTKVVKAQLWVYLRPVQHTSTVYLQILRLKPVTEDGSRHIRIRSLKIDLNSRIGHWQSIDFKHVLQNWFKQPQNNWGIEINAFDPNGNDLAVTSLGPGAEAVGTSDIFFSSLQASVTYHSIRTSCVVERSQEFKGRDEGAVEKDSVVYSDGIDLIH
uniref:Growth/differentiation factor 11 n=1 Tax=Sphaerodactylus townsendi TaxID=933632 RepID=A0ACB8EN22_9SAUR